MNGPAMVPPLPYRRTVSRESMELDGPQHKPKGTHTRTATSYLSRLMQFESCPVRSTA
jgi:hypothetical protein